MNRIVVPFREDDFWATSKKLMSGAEPKSPSGFGCPSHLLSRGSPCSDWNMSLRCSIESAKPIKEIECGISHSLHESRAREGGGKQSKASRHGFCAVPRQPKPRSPSLLLLGGSNMFHTEHIESAGLFHNVLSIVGINFSYSVNASSHSYPWGIKWRKRVMWWIVQELIRFSYRLHQGGIVTGKLCKFKLLRFTQRA